MQPLAVEHATVTIDFEHSRVGDLIIKLTSPNGTEGVLLNRVGVNPGSIDDTGHGSEALEFAFGNVSAWGENVHGDWTLTVEDALTGETGIIKSWSLELSGKLSDLDDIYVYTEEFSELNDVSRLTLNDVSGDDTINVAAISGDTSLDLNAGASSVIDGKTVTLASGTIIERAITGDGNDTLIGNAHNNLLFGGRGQDTLNGNAGNDWLIGAWGNDSLIGGAGFDRFVIRNGDMGQRHFMTFTFSDDLIVLAGYETIKDIDDLTITQNGAHARSYCLIVKLSF